MNLKKCVQKALLIGLAVPAAICGLPAQTNPKTPVWGAPVNGLQISLSLGPLEAASKNVAFNLELQNLGPTDLTVNLGSGCELPTPTDSVAVILADSTGISKRLTFQNKSGCVGALAILAPTLPPGGRFSTQIELDSYRMFPRSPTPDGMEFERGWHPGATYTVEAELKGMGGTTHPPNAHGQTLIWWGGTITSNRLEIHIPSS